jgi:adenylate kinase
MAPLILLMGPTGAGKSLQAAKLAERHNWAFVSMGELLRTRASDEVLEMLNRGELAPPEVAEKLLREAVEAVPAGRPIVLDGYPRMMSEMTWLDGHLSQLQREVKRVFFVTIDPQVSLERIQHRHRTDDAQATADRKWEVFKSSVMPVIEDYRSRGLVTDIDGNRSREDVTAAIEAAL